MGGRAVLASAGTGLLLILALIAIGDSGSPERSISSISAGAPVCPAPGAPSSSGEPSAPNAPTAPTGPSAQPAPPPATDTLTVLQYNVGNAQAGCPPRVPPLEKVRLHDAADIARLRKYFETYQPDVIFLQETLSGVTQLFDPVNPLLPASYDGRCPVDGKNGNGMVCLAWRREKFEPANEDACVGRFLFHDNGVVAGGLVRCNLVTAGQEIQLVSTYVPHGKSTALLSPFADDVLRKKVLSMIWESDLVDPSKPAVIGGDFNTDGCTGMTEKTENCETPYPENFGTLFGRYRADFGRWKTTKTFFGHCKSDGTAESHFSEYIYVCRLLYSKSRIDHVFANFGAAELLEVDVEGKKLSCGSASCIPDDKGFAIPSSMRCRSCDHLPVMARLSW